MKKILVFGTALLISFCSYASDIQVGGRAEMFGSLYDSNPDIAELQLLPNFMWERDAWLLYAELDLRLDSTGFTTDAFSLYNDSREVASFRELYVRYLAENWQVKIGQLVTNWSIVERTSPSDSLSSFDFGDFVRLDERRGVPEINVRLGYDTYVEAIFIPKFVPSILSYEPWTFELPTGMQFGDLDIPDGSEFGIRTGASAGNYDFGVSASYSYSVVPIIELNFPTMIPRYHREKVFSGWVSGELLDGSVSNLEVSYTDRNGVDDFMKFVVSSDYYWNDLLTEGDELYILCQLISDFEINNQSNFDFMDISRLEGFLSKVKYDFGGENNLAIQIESHYNFFGSDYHIQPSVQCSQGNWTAELGAGILGGSYNSFWGGSDIDHYTFFLITRYF